MRDRVSSWDAVRIARLIDAIGKEQNNKQRIDLTKEIVRIVAVIKRVKKKHLIKINQFLAYHGFVAKDREPEKAIDMESKLVRYAATIGLEYGKTAFEFLSNVTPGEIMHHWNAVLERKIEQLNNACLAACSASSAESWKHISERIDGWKDQMHIENQQPPEPVEMGVNDPISLFTQGMKSRLVH